MGDFHSVIAAVADQIQSVACILQIEFYWNTVKFICLLSIHGCFDAVKSGLGSWETEHTACQAQSIALRPFRQHVGGHIAE